MAEVEWMLRQNVNRHHFTTPEYAKAMQELKEYLRAHKP